MKQVDLNWELKNLNGDNIGNAGELLAASLMVETKGDAIKYFDWAMNLNKKLIIEVDESDFLKIKQFITDNERLTLLAKAQFLKYFETVK